jgi:hypothetical protein
VFVLGAVLYARTLGYEFVDLDDPGLVDDPLIREASLEHFAAIWSRPAPLRAVSLAIDRGIWDRDPFGYHLHALLLNALNGALVFWLISRIGRRPVALVAALLFAVHSSHIQTAAWVSARGELLLTAFVLLSAIAYHAARAGGGLRVGPYLASLAAFGLGAAASPAIAGYPLFFLLLDRYEDRRLAPGQHRGLGLHLATKLPYLAIAAPLLWISIPFGAVWEPVSAHPFGYLASRGVAAWRYLFLLIGLAPGQPIYDAPALPPQPFLIATCLAALVAPVLVLAAALWRGREQLALALGWLIAGLLVPILLPLTGFVSDRDLYAPSLGFCWLLALAIVRIAVVPRRSPVFNSAVACALTIPPLFWFSLVAWRFTPVWRSSESLLSYAALTSQGERATTSAASWLIRQERFDEAEKLLTSGRPTTASGLIHLAVAHLGQNRIDDALADTDRALAAVREEPGARSHETRALWVRSVVLVRAERVDEAAAIWKMLLERDPDYEPARAALAALEQKAANSQSGPREEAPSAPRAQRADDR